MASARIASFLTQLRDCDLLTPDQRKEVENHPLALGEDPVPLAKFVLQRGWLTAFQINQVTKGRGQELQLGAYRLLQPLGEGGMGQVFRAYHAPMDRTVALKLIRKDKLVQPTAVQRFYQEIRAAAQLTHPNIVAAFDAGQVGGTHFFAMEYVNGVDLAKLVKESGPLPVATACEYIRQAALGLQHAHERGLVHRDIKPANLLLARSTLPGTRPDTIKILDLGLARLNGANGEESEGLTKFGMVVGTPEFLAPEQAMNSRGVDVRADLYSLGCTLFFLLTGRPPFQGESVNDVLVKHHAEAPPALGAFRSDIPPGVEEITRKLLAKKPTERFQTPEELVVAIAPFAGTSNGRSALPSQIITAVPVAMAAATASPWQESTATGEPSAGLSSRRFRRQSPNRKVAILASLVLLLLGGVLLAFQLSSGGKTAPKTAPAVARAAHTPKGDTAPDRKTSRTPETRPQPTQSTGRPPESANPSGTWTWMQHGMGQPHEITLKLKLMGETLTGTYGRDGKEMPIEDGKFTRGDTITFRVNYTRGEKKFPIRYDGKISGDLIKGKIDYNGRDREWDAKRAPE